MFKCGLCGKDSLPRETATMVVVEKRSKVYPARGEEDKGGMGYETAREVLAHAACAKERAHG